MTEFLMSLIENFIYNNQKGIFLLAPKINFQQRQKDAPLQHFTGLHQYLFYHNLMGFSYTIRYIIIFYTPCISDSNFAPFFSFEDSQLSLFFIRLNAIIPTAGTYKLFRKRLIVYTAFHTTYIHFICFRLIRIHFYTILSITFIKLLAISNSQTVINSNNLNNFSKSQQSLFQIFHKTLS